MLQTAINEEPKIPLDVREALFVNNILSVCAKRGAFYIEEFKDIGVFTENLRKKLEPYVKKNESGSSSEGSDSSTNNSP